MAQGISTPDPSLSRTHFSTRRGRATTTHYIHHQVSLMVLRNTTLVPSMGFCIGPASEAGLSAAIRRDRGPPQRRKKEIKKEKRKKESSNIVGICWTPLLTPIWISLKISPPKEKKAHPGRSSTCIIMQNFTPFGRTVAEISVPRQKKTVTSDLISDKTLY